MKKNMLLILMILSLNLAGADKYYKKVYITVPATTTTLLTEDFKILSLLKDKNGEKVEGYGLKAGFVPRETTKEVEAQYKILSLNYILDEDDIDIKFAMIYKVIDGNGSENYVALLSQETSDEVLNELKDNFEGLTNISDTINILDIYGNWDEFPGIELTDDMSLSGITIRDTTDNILKEISLSNTEILIGDTGGINPGNGNNEFIVKSEGVKVLDGKEVKDNKGNIDSEGTLGYYIGDYISFKPHKHTTPDRIMIQMPDGTTSELPNNSSTEISLEKNSKIKIWTDNPTANGNNGAWYFTITEGGIINPSNGKLTIIEDRGSSIKEVLQMHSLESKSSYERISNVNMTNSLDGEVYFDITDIHE